MFVNYHLHPSSLHPQDRQIFHASIHACVLCCCCTAKKNCMLVLDFFLLGRLAPLLFVVSTTRSLLHVLLGWLYYEVDLWEGAVCSEDLMDACVWFCVIYCCCVYLCFDLCWATLDWTRHANGLRREARYVRQERCMYHCMHGDGDPHWLTARLDSTSASIYELACISLLPPRWFCLQERPKRQETIKSLCPDHLSEPESPFCFLVAAPYHCYCVGAHMILDRASSRC